MMNDLRSVWASMTGVNAPHQITEAGGHKPEKDGFAYAVTLSYDDSNIHVVVQGSEKLKGLMLRSQFKMPEGVNNPASLLSLLNVAGKQLICSRIFARPSKNDLILEMFLPPDISDASAKSVINAFAGEVREVMGQVAMAAESTPEGKTIIFTNPSDLFDNTAQVIEKILTGAMDGADGDKPVVKH